MGQELTNSTTSLPKQGTTVGGDEGDTPSYRCPQIPRVYHHPSSGCYCTMATLTTLVTGPREGAESAFSRRDGAVLSSLGPKRFRNATTGHPPAAQISL